MELRKVRRLWELEVIRSKTLQRRAITEKETRLYEQDSVKAAALHQEMRLLILDRKANGLMPARSKSSQTVKLQTRLTSIEQAQRSRRELLEHASQVDALAEGLCRAAAAGDLALCRNLIGQGASPNEGIQLTSQLLPSLALFYYHCQYF